VTKVENKLEAYGNVAHYGGADNPYEAIKIIEALGLNFALGSAIKYIARHGKKAGENVVSDLRKAAWYCAREADRLEALAKKDAEAQKNAEVVHKAAFPLPKVEPPRAEPPRAGVPWSEQR
jgi:hypothetical protein